MTPRARPITLRPTFTKPPSRHAVEPTPITGLFYGRTSIVGAGWRFTQEPTSKRKRNEGLHCRPNERV